jgi:hypothetical protein
LKYTQTYNLRKPEDTDPADIQDLNYNADAIDTKLKELEDEQTTKVDKISGKGLSTNDYTTDEKNKLAGIEAGAEVNNISDADASELTGGEETNLHKHAAADVNYGEGSIETAVQEISAELVTHKADTMPHLIRDITNNKTYRYGYQMQNGITQFIYEEVV